MRGNKTQKGCSIGTGLDSIDIECALLATIIFADMPLLLYIPELYTCII